MRHALKTASLIITGLVLASCDNSNVAKTQPVRTVSTNTVSIGGPFTLLNQDGVVTTQDDILGKPQLIYFGFGYCPDVCPTALQQMGAALSSLGKKEDAVLPILFSIDPERDTPESLKLYITANGFPKNLIALTGTQAQVDQAMKSYRIYAKRAEDPSSASGYTMDHMSVIYLMDEKGGFVDVFTHTNTPADIAKRLKSFLKTGK